LSAEEESIKSDVFLVLGSSLTVSPANQFPLIAKQTASKLIIINQEKTEFDGLADLVIHHKIGDILEEINTVIG
jgi:NAD-dependent deacetylase